MEDGGGMDVYGEGRGADGECGEVFRGGWLRGAKAGGFLELSQNSVGGGGGD